MGYDLNVRGERLYHAGDTDVIPEMDAVAGVDVALLPVSGTYVMTARRGRGGARRIAAARRRADALGRAHRHARGRASVRRAGARRGNDHGEGGLMPENRTPLALKAMAQEDPELAARLVLQTLPGAAAQIPGTLVYDMEVEELGSWRVCGGRRLRQGHAS